MTKDMILVEREYDGERCGDECRRRSTNYYEEACCTLQENRMVGLEMNGAGCYLRCPSCLATPSAVVLTPEIKARLEALEAVAEAAGFALDDDGAKWVGILRERLDALKALP